MNFTKFKKIQGLNGENCEPAAGSIGESVLEFLNPNNRTMLVVEQKGLQTIPLDVSFCNKFRMGLIVHIKNLKMRVEIRRINNSLVYSFDTFPLYPFDFATCLHLYTFNSGRENEII